MPSPIETKEEKKMRRSHRSLKEKEALQERMKEKERKRKKERRREDDRKRREEARGKQWCSVSSPLLQEMGKDETQLVTAPIVSGRMLGRCR